MRPSRFRSRSAIPTSRSARMCSRRWRATTRACAGPRSRSTSGDDAKNALDRITIPQDVLDRIAPTALPRSSIIVSDEPLSSETNYRTEFVAVLSNQPQGGFITRKPTPDVLVADSSTGATTASASFSSAAGIRNPKPAIRVRAAVSPIIRCNGAIRHNKAIRCNRAIRCNGRASGETRYAGRTAAQVDAPKSQRQVR